MSAPDDVARDSLIERIYPELRALAGHYLLSERREITLQATALVHEAWLRLDAQRAPLRERDQVFAAAALSMRRILVDHARKRARQRHGGGRVRIALGHDDGQAHGDAEPGPSLDLLALDEALQRLAEHEPRRARVVELRFFGGLTDAAIARELAVSERTVRNDWAFSRAWLHAELHP